MPAGIAVLAACAIGVEGCRPASVGAEGILRISLPGGEPQGGVGAGVTAPPKVTLAQPEGIMGTAADATARNEGGPGLATVLRTTRAEGGTATDAQIGATGAT
mmetsp:Transcript_16777/g.29832  ORF Transcript_16777/g.29832 Transcript_16777/m.29832 type:complete len:103 (-) Transcript_16777:11-319(-)